MAFTPINTQEEFNEAIKERLAREAKKFEGYKSPNELKQIDADWQKKLDEQKKELDTANGTIAERDKTIAERDAKIKGYETDSVKRRIAREVGLPDDAVDYLKGEDAEALKKSAESLKQIIGDKPTAPPLADPEPAAAGGGADINDAAYKKMLKGLKGEE